MNALSIIALFVGVTLTTFVVLIGVVDFVDPITGVSIH
jgi:hypothetical protein